MSCGFLAADAAPRGVDHVAGGQVDLAGLRAGTDAERAALATAGEHLDDVRQAHLADRSGDAARGALAAATVEQRADLGDEE